MKRLILLSLLAGCWWPASRACAQGDAFVEERPASASLSALFQENLELPANGGAAETCKTPRGCLVLGTVLTATGVVVSGIGITFLARIDDADDGDDLVTIPVAFLGGALLATGLISTGIGIHLIGRGRRLKRLNVGVGWQGAPSARLRVRF